MKQGNLTLVLVAALAACGSKPPAPAAPPEPPAQPHTEPVTAVAEPSALAPMPAPAPPPTPDPATVNVGLLATERGAWDTARPVFDKDCAMCHTKAGKKSAKKKLDHFDMDTYPPGGHHTATIGFEIREVLGITGKKATMPKNAPGSVKGDDLALIKAWTDAWEAADTAGAHPPAAPGKGGD
jgi:hypothetical protein